MKRAILAAAFVCVLASSLLLVLRTAEAQTSVALAPVAHMQFLDANGQPLAGGCVFTYNAGTTTPLATYTDSTGTVSNPNPIILDSGGFANIWLTATGYKFIVYSSGGVNCGTGTYQWAVDNITAASSGGGSGTADMLISSLPSPATVGIIRMASTDTVCWRSNGGGGNLCLVKDAQDRLIWQLGNSFFLTQGVTPTCIASDDGIYADSTGRLGLCNNGGATDFVVGQNTVDTFSNKTVNFAASGNVLQIAGQTVSSTTGTGAAVLASAPTIAGPTITGTVAGGANYSSPTITAPVINGTSTGTGIPTTTLKSGSAGGDYSTTNASFTAVDATNLNYVVTIPSGWKLLVQASGTFTSSSGAFGTVAINDSVHGILQSEEVSGSFSGAGTIAVVAGFSLNSVVNGDGMSHTLQLQFESNSGFPFSVSVFNRGTPTASAPNMTFLLLPSN